MEQNKALVEKIGIAGIVAIVLFLFFGTNLSAELSKLDSTSLSPTEIGSESNSCQDGKCVPGGDGQYPCESDQECQHTECAGLKCVVMPCPGVSTCALEKSGSGAFDPQCAHLACASDNTCKPTYGGGSNACENDSACGYGICVGSECRHYPGTAPVGTPTCSSNNDCSHTICKNFYCERVSKDEPGEACDPTNDTCGHNECKNGECVRTFGGGASDNTCSKPGPSCQHMKCEGFACTLVDGEGPDECTKHQTCGGYLDCDPEGQCKPMEGSGEDKCTTNADCLGFGCGNGYCKEHGGQTEESECCSNAQCGTPEISKEGYTIQVPKVPESIDKLTATTALESQVSTLEEKVATLEGEKADLSQQLSTTSQELSVTKVQYDYVATLVNQGSVSTETGTKPTDQKTAESATTKTGVEEPAKIITQTMPVPVLSPVQVPTQIATAAGGPLTSQGTASQPSSSYSSPGAPLTPTEAPAADTAQWQSEQSNQFSEDTTGEEMPTDLAQGEDVSADEQQNLEETPAEETGEEEAMEEPFQMVKKCLGLGGFVVCGEEKVYLSKLAEGEELPRDQCDVDSECTKKEHKECDDITGVCLPVPGPGKDYCNPEDTGLNCRHNACSEGFCRPVAGEGQDSCSPSKDICGYNYYDPKTGCTRVPGKGTNECELSTNRPLESEDDSQKEEAGVAPVEAGREDSQPQPDDSQIPPEPEEPANQEPSNTTS